MRMTRGNPMGRRPQSMAPVQGNKDGADINRDVGMGSGRTGAGGIRRTAKGGAGKDSAKVMRPSADFTGFIDEY